MGPGALGLARAGSIRLSYLILTAHNFSNSKITAQKVVFFAKYQHFTTKQWPSVNGVFKSIIIIIIRGRRREKNYEIRDSRHKFLAHLVVVVVAVVTLVRNGICNGNEGHD